MSFATDAECQANWVSCGEKHLLGRKIVKIRYLSKKECELMGWFSRPIVIHFDDGSLVYPSQDDEGNDGGVLFGHGPDGEELTFPVLR